MARDKLDPRLRAMLALDPGELASIKRREDQRRSAELVEIRDLGRRARESPDAGERDKASTELRRRLATFPVPFTFGLYLPGENDRDASRISKLHVPFVSATIRTGASAQDLTALGIEVRSQAGDIFTANVPLQSVQRLASSAAIGYVELARPYRPELVNAIPKAGLEQLRAGGTNGSKVIVGIIDSGLDVYHEHFLTAGASRVLFLWDQSLTPLTTETGPPTLPGFNPLGGSTYGVEYTKAQIDSELGNGLPAYRIVRSNPGSGFSGEGAHGTLVASCAAGNGHVNSAGKTVYVGAAPGADIIHVRTDDSLYADIFAESTNILDAFAYIFARASQLGLPCVINLSSSDNLGPHDGTSNGEQFLDNLLLAPGRAITCSAGNGNIFGFHTRGLVSQGSTTELRLVSTGSPLPTATNDDTVQIWYDGIDQFSVTLTVPTTPPTVLGPVAAGATLPPTAVGGVTVAIASGTNPNNDDNLIEIQITGVDSTHPIPEGTWVVALDGTSVINGAFEAWVDRNNPISFEWDAPLNDEGTLGVPATARRVIAVGAHNADGGACDDPLTPAPTIMNISGCGPTRDGRVKPDLAGPGQVDGARSRDMNQPPPAGYPVTAGSFGTSDSAPIVAGAAALLFECRGSTLSSSDITQLLLDSAGQSAAGVPSNTFGFGYLCVEGICAAPTPDVDVWIRDSITDTGLEPYTGGDAWLSPDIAVLDAAGNPAPNPTYDPFNVWNNLIDVTVRNRGTDAARNVDVFLYWADPATNLPFPGEWHTTGIYTGGPSFLNSSNSVTVAQLAPGASETVRFAWAPPPPGSNIRGDDHFCLIARVEHDSDPSNLGAGGWPVIAGSNNIALHNLHVIALARALSTGFFVVGAQAASGLELACAGVVADLELVVPTRALPWHEMAVLDLVQGRRPAYGCECGVDPVEDVTRVLEGNDVSRILGVTGFRRAFVEGPTTRLEAGRESQRMFIPEIRIERAAKMPVRVWAREPVVQNERGLISVGQRSGGKLTGGISLELRAKLPRPRHYDVRRKGDRVEVTPRH